MAPPGWTTLDQKKFLELELPEYIKLGTKAYKKKWPTLYQNWSDRWPERATALPDMPPDQLLMDNQAIILLGTSQMSMGNSTLILLKHMGRS
ncbi:hypothetical protein JVU11DRAFT_8094 [Chiua virens]|nr:hypothetical protein JVU11DRAFT_8094 [Chiua virens]